MTTLHTFADHDVTLEMDSVALWELEHGEELGLGGASEAVVGELGHDGGVWAAPAVHQLHCCVNIREAEAPPDRHPEAAVIVSERCEPCKVPGVSVVSSPLVSASPQHPVMDHLLNILCVRVKVKQPVETTSASCQFLTKSSETMRYLYYIDLQLGTESQQPAFASAEEITAFPSLFMPQQNYYQCER